MTPMDYTEPRHPINFVCKRTGLSVHLIRAWERRYGAVVPARSATNRRLYSDENVDKLKLLKRLVDGGHTIGNIAELSKDKLESMLESGDATAAMAMPARRAHNAEEAAGLLALCQDAVNDFSALDLRTALAEAQIVLPQFTLITDLIGPLMTWVGDQWHTGNIRVAHEHLATAVVRDVLSDIRRSARVNPNAPRVVVTTPSGDTHEIGAMMAAATASMCDWRDVYLGGDLPAEEIANAVRTSGASAVALSIALPGNDPKIIIEAERVRHFVSEQVPIFVGGAGAAAQRERLNNAGLITVSSLTEFRERLRNVRGPQAGESTPSSSAH